jgi:hypothetical protein
MNRSILARWTSKCIPRKSLILLEAQYKRR